MKNATKILTILLAVLFILSPAAVSGAAAPEHAVPARNLPEPSASGGRLTVFAASSLTDPLNDIAKLYAQLNPGLKITYNFDASGALAQQIKEGASADLFISAAEQQMDELERNDLIVSDTRKNLFGNEIVLIVPADSKSKIKSFKDCATNKVKTIALGDPETVPAGQYAREVFTHFGIWDKVAAKAQFGSDVRQVLSMVASGSVDCGVVYKTDAAADKAVRIAAAAPEGSHTPVVYPAAVVKAGQNQDAAREFLEYLKSDPAMKIFEKYGFTKLK